MAAISTKKNLSVRCGGMLSILKASISFHVCVNNLFCISACMLLQPKSRQFYFKMPWNAAYENRVTKTISDWRAHASTIRVILAHALPTVHATCAAMIVTASPGCTERGVGTGQRGSVQYARTALMGNTGWVVVVSMRGNVSHVRPTARQGNT